MNHSPILEKFSEINVLVIGDVMLDRYWWGSVSRISPEAPVPVVNVRNTTVAAGGAANVAANVAGLGANPFLVGVTGDDDEGRLLPDVLARIGVSADNLVTASDRPTTVKSRIVASGQHVVRLDQEDARNISGQDEESVIGRLANLIPTMHVIVVSDYAKGLLTDRVLSETIAIARSTGTPVLVDPKGKDYAKYSGATLITPNKKEALDACRLEARETDVIDIAGRQLLSALSLDAVLITQSEAGMTLFENQKAPLHLDSLARQVFDVTGAGDTVISTLSVAVGAGADLPESAMLANVAAGIVVEQSGTSAICLDALRKELERN